MKGYIYCLKSRNGRIIYVGQTIGPLHKRLSQHFASRSQWGSPLNYYMDKCKTQPTISLLEEIEFNDKGELYQAESKWVKYLRNKGVNLLNSTTYRIYTRKKGKEIFVDNGKCPVCGNPHLVKKYSNGL